MRPNNPQPTRLKSLALFVLLATLGFIGNFLDLPVSYSVSFIFGSIFAILALQLLGPWCGIGVSLIASSYTVILWNHPYAIIIFTAEMLWFILAIRKGKSNLLLIDSFYWLIIGTPLVILFYGSVMHVGLQGTAVVAMKQSLNGIFNTLVASILLRHTALATWLKLDQKRQPITSVEAMFHLVAAFLMIPTLTLLLLDSRREISAMHAMIAENMQAEAKVTEDLLARWVADHANAARMIADLGTDLPLTPSPRLQQELAQIHALFPDFHNVLLGDATATTIGFDPPVNDRGESTIGLNYADRAWFKQLNRTLQPVVSDVYLGRGGVFKPIFSFCFPVVRDGKLAYFGLGSINLEQMRALLDKSAERKNMDYTIFDGKKNIVLSTVASRAPLSRMEMPVPSKSQAILPDVFIHVPGLKKNMSPMAAWKGAYFYSTVPINGTPWVLLIESPTAPLQKNFYAATTQRMATISILYLLALALAYEISKRFAREPALIAKVTRSIPRRLEQGEEIVWPDSTLAEMTILTDNFRETAQALGARISETKNANLLLEQRVNERTQELHTQQQRLANIIFATNVGTWEWNVQTGEAIFNEQWAEIIGYTLEELAPISIETWKAHVHPEDLQKSSALLQQHFAGELAYFACECRMKHKSGQWIWVLDRGKVISWTDDGKPLMMSGTHADINDRKRLESALLTNIEEFRQLIAQSPVPMAVNNRDGEIELLNESFVKTFGYTLADIPRLEEWWRRAYPDEQYRNEVQKIWQETLAKVALTKTRQEPCEYQVTGKDGAVRTVEITGVEIGGKYLVVINDITARKQISDTLQNINAELEERVKIRTADLERLNRELEGFCYAISHELRAPIARLEGFSTVIAECAPNGTPEELTHLAKRIGVSSLRLRSVVDALLQLNRLARAELAPEPFNLSNLCHQIMTDLHEDIGPRSVRVVIEPDMMVQGDRQMLSICLENLLGNAVKYTGKTPDGTIEVGQIIESGTTTYFVKDNGAGFDMAYAAKLFEPFCRLHNDNEFAGNGIGLASVQRIIERHGGKIWANAAPGNGATFYFSLGDGTGPETH